jgi:hypothetical protein
LVWYHGATGGTLEISVVSRLKSAGGYAVHAALFALLLLFISRTWADPDLWGHVRFGGDIAATGLHSSDPYSFGSDRPWINHEWLAERVMFEAWVRGRGAGLIAAKTALVLAILGFVLATLQRVAMSPPLRILLLFTAVAGLWARVYVFRPQIFSFVLFALLLWLLIRAESGRRTALWFVPVLFALWVNLHGGWIVGLGTLVLWCALNATPFASAAVRPWHLALVLVLSTAATLANPYGVGMWTFLGETIRLERGMIADWQPLLNTGAGKIVAWGTAATFAAIAFIERRPRLPLFRAVLVLGLGAAALKVSRLDGFFSLSVVMLLAPQVASFAEGRKAPAATERHGVGWTAALLAGGSIAVLAWPQPFTCVRLDGPWMPEREAAAWIEQNGLDGRLLTWFDWGQYAIWHFSPDLQVSLDGRRETVYSDEYLARHADLYFNPDSEPDFLRKLDPDHAWLARELPLVAALERDGWTRLFTGPESVVLSRRPVAVVAPTAIDTPPCFPGP